MATISLDSTLVTTINTFTVEPENQQRALELLIEIARRLSREVPGYVSSNFHKSVDGARVVNYAQYTSHEAVQTVGAKIQEMKEDPITVELRNIATPDARTYEVCAIIEGQS